MHTPSSVLRSFSVSRVLSVLACAFALGCSGGTETLPPYDGSSGGGAGGAESHEIVPCDDGAQKDCTVTTVLASGVKFCWHGVQVCHAGSWSKCVEERPPADGSAGDSTANP